MNRISWRGARLMVGMTLPILVASMAMLNIAEHNQAPLLGFVSGMLFVGGVEMGAIGNNRQKELLEEEERKLTSSRCGMED